MNIKKIEEEISETYNPFKYNWLVWKWYYFKLLNLFTRKWTI